MTGGQATQKAYHDGVLHGSSEGRHIDNRAPRPYLVRLKKPSEEQRWPAQTYMQSTT